MSVEVPAGWQVIRQPLYTGKPDPSGEVCLHQPGDNTPVFGCAGISIVYGPHLPGAHGSTYAPNRPDGWYSALDVQQCPFPPAQVNGTMNGIDPKPGLQKGLRAVGSHMADWNRWTSDCTRGRYFYPQAWFLPTSHVVIFDDLGHAETAAVLKSAKFAADGDPMPTASTYLPAHLVSESGNTLIVQPFVTYTSDAAGKAYAKAHKLGFPFADDYLDVDTGPLRTITLTPSTACLGNIELTGQAAYGKPVPCGAFAGHKLLTLGLWLKGSTAESVTELYRP